MATRQKFKRFIRLSIGDAGGLAANFRVIQELKMVFNIKRFTGDSMHSMTMDVYNVNNATKNSPPLSNGKPIQLEAGYVETYGTVFSGIISNVNTFRDGTDIITRLYCVDSNTEITPTVTASYAKSTNLNELIEDIAEKAGVVIAQQSIAFQNTNKDYVFNKPLNLILDDLGKTFNFRYFIFNRLLYLIDTDKGNPEQKMFDIHAGTGLIESPVLTGLGINVKVLMEPRMKPSDRFLVKSGGVNLSQSGLEFNELLTEGKGDQQVVSMTHTGDTHGDAWYTELIGESISGGVV